SRAIRHAVQRGWIRVARRGVYAFAGPPPSRWEQVVAAGLAAGPDAVVSHASAALLHRFGGVAPSEPEITVVGVPGRPLSGVFVHRTRHLDADDIEQRSGVLV